ncbi:MAG: hypothetical protein HPKKFMNG_00389 [Planctomycetes bacterium]|nr:hypothetical protein [Planctomycetota bacterium]HRJ77547.1 hypothetical protein [Planctomycetota bacterium]
MAETAQNPVDYASLIKNQTRQIDIDAFKERGLKKVNVINAKKINELISQAVTNIIGKMEGSGVDIAHIKEDKQQIVQDSMEEFKRLFAEQKKEQEGQNKLQEELAALREQLTQRNESQAVVATSQVSDEIAELKAFMMNQAARAQSEQMTRQAMLEQQQEFLNDRFSELRETLAAQNSVVSQVSASAKLDDDTQAAIKEMASQLKQLVQISRNTEKAVIEQNENINDKLGELREALVGTAGAELAVAEVGGTAIKSVRQMMSDMQSHLDRRNGQEEIVSTLKAEIAGLREDLKDKLVAAADIKASGGGGGTASPEMMQAMREMQEKMFSELAAAGLMKKQVSASEAVEVSNVMVNAAFKGMDDVEVNLGNMEKDRKVDKGAGVAAKKGLDALKKLKGGGPKPGA